MLLDCFALLFSSILSADAARHVMAANTWKKKSKKKRPGYHTVRLNHAHAHRANAQEDARQLASDLLAHEDFVDAPEPLQNDEIRELPTTMHNKKAVKEEVKAAKRKEKKPSVFKTMGYSMSLVSTPYISCSMWNICS